MSCLTFLFCFQWSIYEFCSYGQLIYFALAGADRKDLMRKLPKFIYDEEKALEVRIVPAFAIFKSAHCVCPHVLVKVFES
jgi:hypothetical protein